MKLTLRARTVLLFLFAAVFPAFCVGMVAITQRVESETVFAKQRVFRRARSVADKTENLLLTAKSSLEFAASLKHVRDFASERQIDASLHGIPLGTDEPKRDELRQLYGLRDGRLFDYVFLFNRLGDVYMVVPYERQLSVPWSNYSFRRYFQEAISERKGKRVVSDVFVSTATNRRTVHVVTPVYSDDGRVTGVLGAALRLDGLVSEISRLNAGSEIRGVRTIIVDGCGSLVTEHEDIAVKDLRTDPAVLSALDGAKKAQILTYNDEDYIVGYYPVKTGGAMWGVIVKQSSERALSHAESMHKWFIGLTVLTSVLAATLGWLFAHGITRPLKQLAKAARRISKGEMATRVPVERDDEIGELAKAFNKMAENTQLYRNRVANRAVELETANRRLKELDSLKSSFMANVSHELRTPLNAIIGFAELILKKSDGSNTEETHFIERIRYNAEHLFQIINRVLKMTRIQEGSIKAETKVFTVRELADECMEQVREKAETKGLKLITDIPEDVPALRATETSLEEVLVNLLHNGVEFTKEGEVTLAFELEEEKFAEHLDLPEKLNAVFTVSDTGIGIAPEDIPTVFEPFRQLDSSLSREHGGLGMGLSIARRLVELMNGEITVDSRHGEGSTFRIKVPVQRADSEASDVTPEKE